MISSHVKTTCYFLKCKDHHCLHNLLRSTQMCYCMIETSSVLPRKSSLDFGDLRKMLENVCLAFGTILKNLRKSSESGWEIFGKSSKTSSLVCFYNKQNSTCPLVDTNFVLSCSTRYLTRSLHSLIRYRVEHSKITFISTLGHVI